MEDIVKRLRDFDTCHDGTVDEGADEIERLRLRLRELEERIAQLEKENNERD